MERVIWLLFCHWEVKYAFHFRTSCEQRWKTDRRRKIVHGSIWSAIPVRKRKTGEELEDTEYPVLPIRWGRLHEIIVIGGALCESLLISVGSIRGCARPLSGPQTGEGLRSTAGAQKPREISMRFRAEF
jgi:hypothetical protein